MIHRNHPQKEKDGTAPWRSVIPEGFRKQVASKEPFQVAPLIEYLSSGNAAIQGVVVAHIAEKGPLQAVQARSKYDLKYVQCTDSRQVTLHPNRLLEYDILNKRYAGNVTARGTGLRNVRPGGTIIVEGHETCGACKAAHDHQPSLKARDATVTLDHAIYAIISSIPEYVRCMSNDAERGKANAVIQATYAREILKLKYKKDNVAVCPAFYSWTSGHEWLGSTAGVDLPLDAIRAGISEDARLMTEYALAEGRDFGTQYAALTMLYDPYRLGKVNDPRAVFGALGNEMFCVTSDFRAFQSDAPKQASEKRIATPALGSVMYAGYDSSGGHFGHVSGVGGSDGTHILGIMDTSRDVIENVKAYLLDKFPVIKELTKNGERILPILYDPATVKATFLPS
ncbi:MAG: hypothetical protein PHV13_05425 [Candidatus ainarchaeum sp.]|nr:hypothetical protein [Candidatus ainarchaeum sp.]